MVETSLHCNLIKSSLCLCLCCNKKNKICEVRDIHMVHIFLSYIYRKYHDITIIVNTTMMLFLKYHGNTILLQSDTITVECTSV